MTDESTKKISKIWREKLGIAVNNRNKTCGENGHGLFYTVVHGDMQRWHVYYKKNVWKM